MIIATRKGRPLWLAATTRREWVGYGGSATQCLGCGVDMGEHAADALHCDACLERFRLEAIERTIAFSLG